MLHHTKPLEKKMGVKRKVKDEQLYFAQLFGHVIAASNCMFVHKT